MIAVFGEPHQARSTLGIKVAENKKAVSTATCR
jgi:hypothetical protein